MSLLNSATYWLVTVITVSPFSNGGKNIENGELYITAITTATNAVAMATMENKSKTIGSKTAPIFIITVFIMSDTPDF